MQKNRSRNLVLLMATAMVLVLAAGTAYAATIHVEGPSEVNKFTDPQFSFDIVIDDIGSLANLDFWNLGLEVSPESNATFVSASGKNDPNYVFYGDSYDFGYAVQNPYHIVISDLTSSGGGKTDVAGKLLATVEMDISNADVCELYNINLFDLGTWTLFGDNDENLDIDVGMTSYEFHVVPIPGTLLLLASGLVGFIGVRRRTKKA